MSSSTVIAEFTQHHNFRIPEFLTEDEQAIVWLHDIKRSIDESASAHSQRLLTEEDPSWAMLLTMLERVYEHAAASVVSYFTGTWASSLLQARNCGMGCVSTSIPDCVTTASRRTATPARYSSSLRLQRLSASRVH